MASSPSVPEPGPDPRDAVFDTRDLHADLGRRTGDASVLLLIMSGLKTVQQFVAIAIVARLIGPAEYGVFALALPGVMLARALSNFGLPQAIVQSPAMTHGLATTLFWTNLALAGIMASALAALAWPAAWLFDDPRVTSVMQVLSLFVLLSAAIGQYTAILRRRMRIRRIETVSFLAELAGIVVVVLAALAGLSYWSLVLQQIAVAVLTIVALVAAAGWRPSGPEQCRFGAARSALSFGGFVAGATVMGMVTQQAGTVITGARFDPAAAGLFHRARVLADMPRRRVTIPLSGAFVPSMSRLQDDPSGQQAMLARTLGRSALILLPGAVLMAAAAEPLTLVLLGQDWLALAPLLAWMSLFTVHALVAMALQSVLIGCGQSRALFLFSLVRLVLVVAAIGLTAGQGLVVMTAAYALTEILVSLPLMVAVAQRTTPVTAGLLLRVLGWDLLLAGTLALALIAGVAPRLNGAPALAQLAVLAGIVGAVYALRVAGSAALRGEVRRVATRYLRGLGAARGAGRP